MAWVMQKTMKVSGAEALCVAANVFIGQTEAPVMIAPYIPAMTKSELLTMMTGGMAHVSGAVMLAYVTMGAPLKYLITASVMAAPGTFMIAKILWPETEEPATMGTVRMKVEKTSANFIDAAASGASQGMTLVLNISAMLIAFVALIAMLNGFLGWVGGFFGQPAFQLQTIFGWVLGPLAVILGVPKQDAAIVGNLIANKTVINEFFAFSMMKDVVGQLTEKGKLIATFALCGFANFSSIGIQIGGIGGLAPTRKSDLARLGFRALLAGSLVSFMTAAIAGIIYGE
jgi:CNT family concentrative nucleoside transporter